jgi:dTDP-4-amino-4,6-dideoxygalactose transaminase
MRFFLKKLIIIFFLESKNSQSNYWLNSIVLKNKKKRNQFLEKTNSKGVKTRPIWKLMSDLKMFKDCQIGSLKNAKYLQDRVVNIPSSVRL